MHSTASHVYSQSIGNFTITLTATDEDGSYSETRTIQVLPVNPAAIGVLRISEGDDLTLTVVAAASDSVGVDFNGDNLPDNPTSSGTPLTISWSTLVANSIDDNGTYSIPLVALYSSGSITKMATQALIVDNTAPTATLQEPGTVSEGGIVTISASIGTVLQAGTQSGTWSWSFDTTDGPDDGQSITITASDSDGASSTTTFDLVVNNLAPTANDATFDVVENSANGTAVGTVTASDPGEDTLTFNITGGSGATAFDIHVSTGAITVADSAQLDFETTTSFSLEVTVTDDDGATDVAFVIVNLLNQASISGTVFVGVNQDGLFDANEIGADGVLVQLLDAVGNVLDTTATSDGGFYLFEDFDPATYQIHELQPTGVDAGLEQLGSLGGAIVANDTMQLTLQRTDAFDYIFAELGQAVTSGNTAINEQGDI